MQLYDHALDEQLYKDKQQFDDIPLDQFKRSRAATNPYETLGQWNLEALITLLFRFVWYFTCTRCCTSRHNGWGSLLTHLPTSSQAGARLCVGPP